MSSKSETGHPKNKKSFEDLLASVTAFGTAYNPVNPDISLAALSLKLTAATNALNTVNTSSAPWKNAVAARQLLFTPLGALVTRIVAAVAAAGLGAKVLENVKTYTRKLQGRRASPKQPDVAPDPNNPGLPKHHSNSASQMSFDNRIDNFGKLVEYLLLQTGYAPTETELTLASLSTRLASMRTSNSTVITALKPLDNARIARDKVLYDPATGLVFLASEVKNYVKSHFGGNSPEYKQVLAIKFRTIKPK